MFVSETSTPTATNGGSGTLPFTGLNLGWVAVAACLMLGFGLIGRSLTPEQ
jgi:hypothetical protein